MVLVEYLNEAAHVSALEIMGQIDEKIDRTRGGLGLTALIENLKRIFYIFDPNLLQGNFACILCGLNVYHKKLISPCFPQLQACCT